MGAIATDLLPGDVELARRAAGGDGAAFVRLFDHYSADVFEASLAATGEVETAADATQAAFLNLLRRPPAMGAPQSEVAGRLRALALGAAVDATPMSRRTPRGGHAPAGAGVGWLRSETVAKAGERFDDDWSTYLTHDTPKRVPVKERVAAERPLVVPAVPAAAAAEALPRLAVRDPAPPRRRLRPRLTLLSPAVAGGLLVLALALLAGAAGVILAGDGGDEQTAERALATAAPTRGEPGVADVRRTERAGRTRAGRRSRGAGRGYSSPFGLGAAERAFGGGTGGGAGPVRFTTGGHRTTGGGSIPVSTRPPGSQSPQRVSPGATRTPTAIKAPAPPEPTTSPAPPESSPEPAPEPAPTPAPSEPAPPAKENGGTGRSCNSKNAGC
jgi:DNA-directed RNA polymerase specialized sigma24 family protein